MLQVGVLSLYLSAVRYKPVQRDEMITGRKKRIVRGVKPL